MLRKTIESPLPFYCRQFHTDILVGDEITVCVCVGVFSLIKIRICLCNFLNYPVSQVVGNQVTAINLKLGFHQSVHKSLCVRRKCAAQSIIPAFFRIEGTHKGYVGPVGFVVGVCHGKYCLFPALYICGQGQVVDAGRIDRKEEFILGPVKEKNAVTGVLQRVGEKFRYRRVHAPADIRYFQAFTGVGDGREEIDAEYESKSV